MIKLEGTPESLPSASLLLLSFGGVGGRAANGAAPELKGPMIELNQLKLHRDIGNGLPGRSHGEKEISKRLITFKDL